MTAASATSLLSTGESAQGYVADPRNDGVLVYVNGAFVPRDQASVSVFDSGFVLGDGIWEGLRLVQGRLISLDAHLDRSGRRDLDRARHRHDARRAHAGGARHACEERHDRRRAHPPDGDARPEAHAEPGPALRGRQGDRRDRRRVQDAEAGSKAKGLALFTSTFRTSGPDVFDLRLNSHSRLNLIQALIQAIHAGADEALMLDPRGFVASCNSTNFFVVRKGELWTSTGAYSFKGITQRNVIDAWTAAGGVARECDFTLAQAYAADEAFVTGTLGGVTPVTRIDGRTIGDGRPGPMTLKAGALYTQQVTNLPAR
jgi:branched-chain amino acid aminotransferase